MVRQAKTKEAGTISKLIKNTLLVSNVGDYGLEIVANLTAKFTTKWVTDMMSQRITLVHVTGQTIDGTVSLGHGTINTFFVAPNSQGTGVGTKLMDTAESIATEHGYRSLKVDASLTAVGFYRKRGYKTEIIQIDEKYGDVIVMEKVL